MPRCNVSRRLVFVGFLAASALGCPGPLRLHMEEVTFNPRFSVDRAPIPQEPDPTLGTFRRGPGQSASYVYPQVGEAYRLIQGDCFWLAHDRTTNGGDFVTLNWEAMVQVQSDLGGGKRFAPGDNRFTLCRLDHPVERRSPEIIAGSAPPAPIVMTVPMDSSSPPFVPPPLELGEWAIRQQRDLAWT